MGAKGAGYKPSRDLGQEYPEYPTSTDFVGAAHSRDIDSSQNPIPNRFF